MMAERGIRTATDLQRRLRVIGIEISTAQLSRIVNSKPQRLSLELLEGLMTVLECDANALLSPQDDARSSIVRQTERLADQAPPRAASSKRPRKRKVPIQGSATGPKVAPFPIAKRSP
jgi:DNA-binding Xre family transcriptional regulator